MMTSSRNYFFSILFLLSHSANVMAQPGTKVWDFTTINPILASPPVAADGTIYAASYENIYALTPGGSNKWIFPTPFTALYPDFYSSPAIGSNGTIYVAGAANGVLYALDSATGTNRWTFSISSDANNNNSVFYSSPAIGSDGAIYIGGYKIQNNDTSYLYAINSDGTKRWRYATPNGIYSSPVISQDGATIYFGCDDHILYALSTNGTTLRWTFDAGATLTVSPAIGKDGAIYFGSTSASHKFFAVNTNGTQRWSYLLTNASASVNSSAAIGDDGTIYFGSNDHYLYAMNPNGTLKWSALCGNAVESSPAIAADGIIYVGCGDGKIYAFDGSGSNLWTFPTGNYVSCSPAIGTNGNVYVGSADNKFYALSGDSSLARTQWPMFRHDLQHTARSAALANTPPAISPLANQSINQNTTLGPLPFTLTDAETPAGNLIVSGTSSNTGLVPNTALLFSGTSSNRFLTVTPATNQSGTTLITLTVTDVAGATNSTSFLLTVSSINHAPLRCGDDAAVLAAAAVDAQASTSATA